MATNNKLQVISKSFGTSCRCAGHFSVWHGILAEPGAGASCRDALSWLCSA